MELHFSRNFVANTVLSDSDGQLCYRICTPFKWSNKTTVIYRICRGDNVASKTDNGDGSDEPYGSVNVEEELAKIHWHVLDSSKLEYGGQIVDISKFMPRNGALGRTRTFKGPDDCSYIWHLGRFKRSLADESKQVARLRRANFFTGRKAVLEVFPAGMHMLDLIVTTFVFVEKIREDRTKGGLFLGAA
ncbi:hypothetical protein A0H81_04955 [Grifola frondosa]|uniref:DUF6593 domain-containing protein n=1 Tax=Grifola frondosa TaxID=5627 RepID=A0A1C7MFN6_GRIFR|nr:hypothetical protein A0H81_04955 [Grifola frondosa]